MFFYFDSFLSLVGLAGLLYQTHSVRDTGANLLVVILTVFLLCCVTAHAAYTYSTVSHFFRARYTSSVFIGVGDFTNLIAGSYALWQMSSSNTNGIHYVIPLITWTFGSLARMFGDYLVHERLKDQWIDSMITPLSEESTMPVTESESEGEEDIYQRRRNNQSIIRDDPFTPTAHDVAFVIDNDDQEESD